MKTQKEAVLEYLKKCGPISPLKAQSEFGIWRLASVIHRLRSDGYRIVTIKRKTFSGKPFVNYKLVRKSKA